MTQLNNEFEKAMSKKFAWNNTEHILQNPDEYSETVYLCVYYANEGWQAATQHSESILQEQQNTIAELKIEIEGYNLNYKDVCVENLELQAHINELREALEYHTEQTRPIQKTIDALASTPAQSLQAHGNRLIERVITLLKDSAWGDGIIDMRVDDLIEDVRALKGK